jgi:hypothetical protein
LPWGPEAQKDVPPNQDLPPNRDVRDVAADVSLDLPVKLDVPPKLDSAEIDATAIDSSPIDADPTLPVVVPNKLVFSPGEAITVTWANGSTEEFAWVGIYPVRIPEVPDSNYLPGNWGYTGGLASGSKLLHVPATTGPYELRLFSRGSEPYGKLATSVPFVVQ